MKLASRTIAYYLLTWALLLLLGNLQPMLGFVPAEFSLPQLAPALAALLMLAIFARDRHQLVFHRWPPIDLKRYLLAAGIPIAMGVVIGLVSLVTVDRSVAAPVPEARNIPLLLLWAPLGALGEELGWRGYLHKRLAPHLRGVISSLLIGLLWAPMHFNYLQQGPLLLGMLFLLIVSYSIVIFLLVQDTGFAVLLAALLHFSVSVVNLFFFDRLYDPAFMATNAVCWAVLAIVLVVMRPDILTWSRSD